MMVLYVDDDSDDREIFGAAIHAINPDVVYNEFDGGEEIISFLKAPIYQSGYIFGAVGRKSISDYRPVASITVNVAPAFAIPVA